MSKSYSSNNSKYAYKKSSKKSVNKEELAYNNWNANPSNNPDNEKIANYLMSHHAKNPNFKYIDFDEIDRKTDFTINWNNITTLKGLFVNKDYQLNKVKSINLRGKIKNLRTLDFAFCSLLSLETLDLTGCDFSNVKDIKSFLQFLILKLK